MRFSITLIVVATLVQCTAEAYTAAASPPVTQIFHPRPDHPWNGVHAALWLRRAADGRTYGHDRLDPLLWPETRHLTQGDSAKEALARLDAFLSLKDPRLEKDHLKRAILQRDLWAVFDWLAVRSRDLDKESATARELRRHLLEKLAKAIQRLALSREQIDRLPDNYAVAVTSKQFPSAFDADKPDRPFLPPRLFDSEGPWVCLGTPDGPVAPGHLRGEAGLSRSDFLVFLRLPGGRNATLEYLKRLQRFEKPWVKDPRFPTPARLTHNPETPQFPAGTQAALVRRMLLIDSQGRLTPSPIVEQVQLRVYRRIAVMTRRDPKPAQRFLEFNLSRERLFAGQSGGLAPVDAHDRDFIPTPFAHGFDKIETHAKSSDASETPLTKRMSVTLQTCFGCHREPGVLSFNAYARLFGPQYTSPPRLFDTTPENSTRLSIYAKQQRYDWGLLTGLFWSSRSRAPVSAAKPHAALRSAVTRGLAIVQKAARNYPSHRKCFSCHHQTLPLLAMREAKAAGFAVDKQLMKNVVAFTRKSFRGRIADLKAGRRIGGRAMTVGYGLWTLELSDARSDDLTNAMVTYLVKTQEKSGAWSPPSHRPPLEESRITCTYLGLYGIVQQGDESKDVKKALDRAFAWLLSSEPKSTEDRVFLLSVMEKYSFGLDAKLKKKLQRVRQSLLSSQRKDGGWAQLPEMKSDAYATGQALFVLLESGEAKASPTVRRAVDFLLKTQQKDGSWFVKTRSRPVQVFFDNGDPHGKSQFISIPATSWATAALAKWLTAR